MLKVVGASWLQTRISTYILVAVALLGIGAVILGEFGRVENDGTYSATVWWKRISGYRIDFWGQGNDLKSLPLGAARAYYKTGILQTGWSTLEIETSPDYPDDVQAYAAGLLEGSLTWQLIHHHWYNTVRAACAPRASLCRKMRRYLRENAANARENAALLRYEDPYWHMVHLYYVQLDGLAEGWRFAVQRSRQDVNIDPEDFLWLAMASDLPDLERANNGSDHHIASDGMIVLKAIEREHFEPLMALAHNTAAPYSRMLRLMKRYKFSYRVSPEIDSEPVPGHSIVMTSYPGALSSQDESYMVVGENRELIVAGTPLIIDNHSLWSRLQTKDRVMSAGRIMAANRLATSGLSWSRLLDRQNSGTSNRQWISIEPRTGVVSLIEQIPGFTQHVDHTNEFRSKGYLGCTGAPYSSTIRELLGGERDESVARAEQLALLQANITSVEGLKALMRGEIRALSDNNKDEDSDEPLESENTEQSPSNPTITKSNDDNTSSSPLLSALTSTMSSSTLLSSSSSSSSSSLSSTEQLLAYRGDLASVPRPLGVIDSKLFLFDLDGLETFEARAGPARRIEAPAFDWTHSFPNSSHLGQPEIFSFDSLAPAWVWL
ncbi:hypothetical protein TSAR_012956 [Trichomalopsis sarcophagae]|uniref:Phospholipase B-like n=1 Tax=Trichomalopsis sarcophagae TaxID=543379 RepID=A0A232FE58_9HYME|nr:hypothetical protein TSAR_012956 [Trichomalopsis sarcophagae]